MLLFKDGFDVNTAANGILKWDTVGTAGQVITGVYGKGSAIQQTNRTKTLPASIATGFQGFHFFCNSPSAVVLCAFLDSGSNQCDLRMNGSGGLFFTRNGTTIGSVASTNLAGSTWYWIVPEVTIHPSAGVANVNVNGSVYLAQTSLNTRSTGNSTFNQVQLVATSNNFAYDSYHVWDTAGGDAFNTFIAETIIDTKLATGAGSNAAWTPNASTNFSRVNEVNHDGDTTYNSSSTANQIDSFVFGNLDEVSGTILDVAINTISRIDDATPRVYDHYIKSSSATALSAGISPASSYGGHQTFHPLDPNTSAAWTVSGRNAAEFGYKLIS